MISFIILWPDPGARLGQLGSSAAGSWSGGGDPLAGLSSGLDHVLGLFIGGDLDDAS